MIRIRRGEVTEVRERRPGLQELAVSIDGETAASKALAYTDLCGPVVPGDVVILNTTAVALGLGTGGFHLVVAVEGAPRGSDPPVEARAMKLRYTPMQVSVRAFEEAAPPESVAEMEALRGMPVVAAGLHSAVAPVVIAARAIDPKVKVAYVMSDGGALPMVLSDSVHALVQRGLLHSTVTYGHAFGGEIEAVSKYSALLAAAGAGADIAVVAMGPGNLGTGSTYGHASIEVAEILNAAAALGGAPVAVARISEADPRARHRGVSHHTIASLGLVPGRVRIPVAALDWQDPNLRSALEALSPPHDPGPVDLGASEAALAESKDLLSTMKRSLEKDGAYFRTAAAAGVAAVEMLGAT